MATPQKLQRTVNSVNEHLIQLPNARANRHFEMGPGWNKLRIGMRVGFYAASHVSFAGDSDIYFGVMSAPSIRVSPNRDHVLECHFTPNFSGAQWNYDGTNNAYYVGDAGSFAEIFYRIYVDDTNVTDERFSPTGQPSVGALPSKLLALFLEVTKGSPWTIEAIADNAPSNATVSNADMDTWMTQSDLTSLSRFSSQGAATFSVDEAADGEMVKAYVAYDRASEPIFEMADFFVSRLD